MGERDASREWMEGPQRLKFPSCAAEIVSCPTTTRRAGARRSAAAITGAGGQPWLCRPVHDPRITLAYVIMRSLMEIESDIRTARHESNRRVRKSRFQV